MRYQLRYAAGMYWLLDTCQEGVPYKAPLTMNKTGADIWDMMSEGLDREEIAEKICGEYGTDRATAQRDIEQFQAQLAEYGIEGAEAAGEVRDTEVAGLCCGVRGSNERTGDWRFRQSDQ